MVGSVVGWLVGSGDGTGVGGTVGSSVGWLVGSGDGTGVGGAVGSSVGWLVGSGDGIGVGRWQGLPIEFPVVTFQLWVTALERPWTCVGMSRQSLFE